MIRINWKKDEPVWVWSLLILGILASVIGLIASIVRPDVNDFTSEAEGVVYKVEVKTSRKKKGGTRTSYITHVRFEDSDHRTFEAQSVVNGSWHRHYEGDKVTVRYNPRDPASGVIIKGDEDKLGEFNFFIAACDYGGLVLLIVGVFVFMVPKLRA